jgi:hypothetical protein
MTAIAVSESGIGITTFLKSGPVSGRGQTRSGVRGKILLEHDHPIKKRGSVDQRHIGLHPCLKSTIPIPKYQHIKDMAQGLNLDQQRNHTMLGGLLIKQLLKDAIQYTSKRHTHKIQCVLSQRARTLLFVEPQSHSTVPSIAKDWQAFYYFWGGVR